MNPNPEYWEIVRKLWQETDQQAEERRAFCARLAWQRLGMLSKAQEQAAIACEAEGAGESVRAKFAAREATGFLRTADRLATAMQAYGCPLDSGPAGNTRPTNEGTA